MAYINPTSIQCSPEPHSGKRAYLKLTITSISDSDASTNQRYVGWKITVEGTPWSTLRARYASLGGHEIRPFTTASVSSWKAGQQLDSGNETYSNDSAGNLTLYAYLKQLFYYAYSDSNWNGSRAQAVDANMVCSQLPRYANFTAWSCNWTAINKMSMHWNADAVCDVYQYSLNGGAWTNGAYWPDFEIGGLSPGTQYNIRMRIKRQDSQLWTTSGYLYPTTQSLPSTGTPSNFNLGSSPTPSISSMNNLSYWYVHTYDDNTLLNDSGAIYSTSKTIDLTNSTLINQMLARHPNENEWNITFKYYCVSNEVTYTLTQRICKCVIPQGQYTPTFNENNVSYEVTDQQTLDLTGSNKKVIKGISDILVTVTPASPNGSATMKSYNATSGNSTGSTTNIDTPTISLTNVNAGSVTVQAVDSRNRTANANKAFSTFIDYFSPVITSASINRIDGVGTNLAVNITGNYCDWSGLSTTNIMEQVSIQYKLKSASTYTTISGVNLNIVNNNGAFTITGNITGNHFSAAEEYDVLLTFKDKINNLPFYQSIPTGEALLWRDKLNKRIGIKRKPNYDFDVDGNANVDALYVNGTKMMWHDTGTKIYAGNTNTDVLYIDGTKMMWHDTSTKIYEDTEIGSTGVKLKDTINKTRYIKVNKTVNQVVNTTSQTGIPFDSLEINDSDGIFQLSPAGYVGLVDQTKSRRVKVTMQLWIEKGGTSYAWYNIARGDAAYTSVTQLASGIVPKNNGGEPWISISLTTIIELTPSQPWIYPRIYYVQSSSYNQIAAGTYANTCYLIVEALD